MEGRTFLKQRIYIIASKTVRLSIQDAFPQPSYKLCNCRKICGCKILVKCSFLTKGRAKTVDQIYLLMDRGRFNVNTLAENLCMSPRQFHRKITALTGDTPASYILRIKMQKARQLLESKPGMTVEEIAEKCGFEHVSSFYHSFKKMHGTTPANYKKGGGI